MVCIPDAMRRGLSWRGETRTVVEVAFLSTMAACLLRVASLPSVIVQRARPTTAGLGGSFRWQVALPSSRALRPWDINCSSGSRWVKGGVGIAAGAYWRLLGDIPHRLS